MSFSVTAIAQIKDSCINVWQCEINYAYQFSLTDLRAKYGKNPSTMGLGLSFKTKHNWIFGFEGSYLWGGYDDNGVSILRGIMTQSGNIINSAGEYGTVLMTQSGFYAGIKTGYVFSFRKPNPNSGIVVNIGAGILEHHIRIENRSNNTPSAWRLQERLRRTAKRHSLTRIHRIPVLEQQKTCELLRRRGIYICLDKVNPKLRFQLTWQGQHQIPRLDDWNPHRVDFAGLPPCT